MSAPPALDRRHDLDALRAVAMLLGIVLHGGLAYVTFPAWPVYDETAHHRAFDILFTSIHGFRMPLFFVISGFFTAMLWRKRGLRALLLHRFRRIFLPLAIFLIPITVLSVVIFGGMAAWEKGRAEGPAAAKNSGEVTVAVGAAWVAARDGDVEALQMFLEAGEAVNSRDPQYGIPLLTWAAMGGSPEAVELLLESGAEVGIRSQDQSTPLSSAAFFGRTAVVALLIEKGADANAVNHHQATPLDNTKSDWGVVQWIAGFLKLEIDKAVVQSGREETAILLREKGGLTKAELDGAEAMGARSGRGGKRGIEGLTQSYLVFIEHPLFHRAQFLGHLWFLWFLCLLLVPFALYALASRALKGSGPPKALFRPPLVLLWIVPLTMVPQWFHGLLQPSFGPDTTLGLVPFPHVILLYAVYFFFGALYFDSEDEEGRLGRFWWLALPAGLLLVYPVGLGLAFEPEDEGIARALPESAVRPLAVFLQALFAWLMIFGMMGLFRAVCSRESKALRYVSDSAYFLYLVHLPLIFVPQYAVQSLEWPAAVKFAFVVLSLTAFLLLVYQVAVRYTWLGALLNGKRVRPGKGGD